MEECSIHARPRQGSYMELDIKMDTGWNTEDIVRGTVCVKSFTDCLLAECHTQYISANVGGTLSER